MQLKNLIKNGQRIAKNGLPISTTEEGLGMKSIELLCLAHRYLQFVKLQPILSMRQYILLEKEAKKAVSRDSIIWSDPSDIEQDYPNEAKELAEKLAA